MSAWYAIQTKPRKEDAVLAAIARAGLESYCPRFRHKVRRAGRWAVQEAPLFPGYLFVKLAFLAEYPRIRWTPGLVRVVTSGGMPVRVGEEMLQEIRSLEKVGMRHGIRSRSLPTGSRVRIVEGPFAGFEGRVAVHLNGGERIRILLELFQTQASLDCEAEVLEPVGGAGGRP